MFSAMQGTITGAMVLSVLVVVIAGLAEGRGRHLLRVILGISPRKGVQHVYDDVARDESDWDLLGGIDSEPEEVPGTERARQWTHVTLERSSVVARRAVASANAGASKAVIAGRHRLDTLRREQLRALQRGATVPMLDDVNTRATQHRPALPRRRELREVHSPVEPPQSGELVIAGR